VIGSYKSIVQYYKELFLMVRYSDFNLTEVNRMLPYELEIYVSLQLQAVQEEKAKRDSK
jgi:hypothetical protein